MRIFPKIFWLSNYLLQLLGGEVPGKIQGQPGNAFELVYGSTTEAVRRKMHTTDPTLCEWIRQAPWRHIPL